MDYRTERGKMLLSRRNQLLLEFSFWDEPVPRSGSNIYELRSYQLRVRLPLVEFYLVSTIDLIAIFLLLLFLIIQFSQGQ